MSRSIEKHFSVPYRHRLFFTRGVFQPDNPLFSELVSENSQGGPVKVLFVLDSGVSDTHPDLEERIVRYCETHSNDLQFRELLQVPGGERSKNSETYARHILEAIDRQGICRHSLVVAIGGGAVIDMAGYAASIAHRGVRMLRIPTTVLAQNDAAVGVKNGLNAFGKKNFVGTFAVPLAIINDVEFLHTLEDRDWIAGMAEAVKVALIRDAAFFYNLEATAARLRQRDMEAMDQLIYRCAELHMEHIAEGGDPFEGGSSRPLDFGHWAAHKLEHMTGYSLRHGEAVAIGMALDVTYSHLIGWLDQATADRITSVLETMGFDLGLPDLGPESDTELLKGLTEFQEHLGGKLTITLLRDIGVKEDVHEMDRDLLLQAIGLLRSKVTQQNP